MPPTEVLAASLADRYTIERLIGEGGMATVYLARDVRHNRPVALKVLRPDLGAVVGVERFLAEIQVTANLQHPNLLPLFDSGAAGDLLFYVMPYVQGESLRVRLDREKQLPVEEAVRLATAIAGALDYAHRQGVIHRDLKPENVLLHDGQPLVADFGIALAVSNAGGTRITQTGLSLGTPHYMSPEQATGDRVIDGRTDIYSLGALTYEMLTGEPPHVGSTSQAIISRVLTERPRSIRATRASVPEHVEAAVEKALEKLPADRWATAREFVDALTGARPLTRGATSGTSAITSAAAAAVVTTRSTSRWKERAAIPLAIGAAVLLIAAIWGWLRPGPTAPTQVARFPIVLPDSAPLQQQFGIVFALSDDGSNIVYAGPGENDIDLWVRPLNALTATRLPGTNGADSPFLSPDGEVVAFYRGSPNALHTVTLRGGPRQTIATDSMLALGGDFGPDGSIYFVRRDGIRRARAGAVEEVTRVDSAAGDAAHGWVDVLPNGRGALFTIERGREDQYDIAVVNLESRKVTILLRGVYARYAPTGHIVYATADGGLFAIQFDDQTLATRGSAIPIVAGVVRGERGVTHFAVASNGTLLYGAGAATGTDQVEWVDRTGRSQVVDTTLKGPFDDLALSPDGRRLAISQRDGNRWNVWIKDLSDGPMGKLTLEGEDNYSPSWMPGGDAVVFVSERGGRQDLYRRRVDGSSAAELLLRADRPVNYGFVSPDRQWIIYQTTIPPSRDLYARRVSGDTTPIALAVSATAAETGARLSRDGRWLAYTSTETGQPEVYVSPFPNTSASRTQVSLNGGSEPLWSRDGRELFYMAGLELTAARIEATPPAFRVTSRTRLFSRGPYNRGATVGMMYDISPDGQRFIMTRKRGDSSERLVLVLNWFAELTAANRSR